MSTNLARFKIIGSVGGTSLSTARGYDFTAGETLHVQLEGSSSLISRATFQVYDPSDEESPLATFGAPALTLDNGTDGPSEAVDAKPAPTSSVEVLGLPAVLTDAHSWMIRCTVDGGINSANGKRDPDRVFQRVVSLRSAVGNRKICPTETTEYSERGVIDSVNELSQALDEGAPELALQNFAALRLATGVPNQRATIACLAIEGDEGGGSFVYKTAPDVDDGVSVANIGGLGSSSAGWRRRGDVAVRAVKAGAIQKALIDDAVRTFEKGDAGDADYVIVETPVNVTVTDDTNTYGHTTRKLVATALGASFIRRYTDGLRDLPNGQYTLVAEVDVRSGTCVAELNGGAFTHPTVSRKGRNILYLAFTWAGGLGDGIYPLSVSISQMSNGAEVHVGPMRLYSGELAPRNTRAELVAVGPPTSNGSNRWLVGDEIRTNAPSQGTIGWVCITSAARVGVRTFDAGAWAQSGSTAGTDYVADGVDALRNRIGIKPGEAAILSAFNPFPDVGRGGGTFIWIDEDMEDDGGTIFTEDGFGETGSHWHRLFSGPIDVTWFGAIGDGVTDDTVAIQRAFDAAVAAGGPRAVLIPRGTYVVSAQLNVASTAASPLLIYGTGTESHLVATLAADSAVIRATGSDFSGFTIRDIRISGSFSRGIDMTATTGSNNRVERCKISGATIGDSSVTIATIAFGGIDDVWIVDNELSGNGRNIASLAFTADAGTDVITSAGHGLASLAEVTVVNSGGALPAPLVANTTYFVRDVTSNTFKLSATSGGAAIDLTTNGTGTNSVVRASAVTFTADAGTNAITATAHGLADGAELTVSNSGGALPAPLVAGTSYFVRDKTADTFKLAATSGGAAIDLTTAGTGTNKFTRASGVGRGYEILARSGQNHSGIHVKGNKITGGFTYGSIFLFDVFDSEVVGNDVDQGDMPSTGAPYYEGGYGILIYDSLNPTPAGATKRNVVAQNRVRNCSGLGIYLALSIESVVSANVIQDTCRQILDPGLAIGAISCASAATPFATCTITGNLVKTSGSNGIIFTSPNTVVSSNYIEACFQAGIRVNGTSDAATVVGNTCVNCLHGLLVNNAVSPSRMSIIGNTFEITSGSGIASLTGCTLSDSTIHGNTISGGQFGIYIDTGTYNRITGNAIKSGSDYGIRLISGAANNLISSNTIRSQNYGINVSSDNNQILDNDLSGVATTALVDTGATNLKRDNRGVTGFGGIGTQAGVGGFQTDGDLAYAAGRVFTDEATVQTTDATVTTLLAYNPPDDRIVRIFVVVFATQSDESDVAVYERKATFETHSASNPTQVGSTATLATDESAGAAAWDATIDASGSDIRVRVTGQAAQTINWRAHVQIALSG